MTFAGYEVLGRIAEGSTGVVWRARQIELDRIVAIKELSPVLLNAPGFLDRFRTEAQTLAGLDDPHVVRIYDYVEEPARAYLVEEWVDGAPLAGVLHEHGRLSPEQSLGVLRGGLMGLAHAHQRELVHRDVSPANILLDREGVSKLVDFGLAAPTSQGLTPGAATSVGTPAFTSPEAVLGQPMTTRSDVYSAAVVLYFLLSGRLPYSGDAAAMLQAHISAPVPRLNEHGPELGDLLARGMAKDPAQRPADAAAFLAELEDAATKRYGPGWLNRASVAGLVSAATTAAGATAAATSGAAAAAAPATTATVASTVTGNTAAGTPGAAQLAGTATRTGARLLGMPMAAAITALVLVIAAIVATVVIVTSGDDAPPQAAGQGAVDSSEDAPADTTETAPTTVTPEVPAFSGTYTVTRTITATEGGVAFGVGDVDTVTWTVTSNCTAGPCDITIASSSGLQFTYAYSGGSWIYAGPTPLQGECFTDAGEPTGQTTPFTRAVTLTPTTPYDPSSPTPVAALSGTGSDTFGVECGEAGRYDFTIEAVRTGD